MLPFTGNQKEIIFPPAHALRAGRLFGITLRSIRSRFKSFIFNGTVQ